MRAIGSELEFINIAAAIAKLLCVDWGLSGITIALLVNSDAPLRPFQAEQPTKNKRDRHGNRSYQSEEDGYDPKFA